jgi:type I restriction enzyme S subunit
MPSIQKVHRSAPSIEAAYKRSRVTGGDVLVSVKGTTGRIGIVPEGFVGNISRDVARLRLNEEHDPTYWFQMLQAPAAQRTLQQAAVGSTRQELSIGTLKMLTFPFPNRREQERIAAILSDVDHLIGALERLLAKKQAAKQAMSQLLLFGKVRLPGFVQPWVERSISDIALIAKGKQLGRAEMDATERVPVWNGGVEPSGFTSSANVRRPVVTVSEGGNSCGWVGRPEGGFWLGGHCYALDPRGEGHTVGFLYHRLKSVESQIMALRVGSGLPNIQKTRLAEFRISTPTDPKEAAELTAVLDDADSEIRLLRRRLEKASRVKVAMTQELLPGHGHPGSGEGAP